MKKFFKWSALLLLGISAIAVVIFAVWVNLVYKAEPEKLAAAVDEKTNDYRISEKPDYWEIIPNNPAGVQDSALIFYPGAKVEPNAYFYKLSALANGQAGKMKVFVTKPTLNLAVFNINQADSVMRDHPEIKKWIIGGHSLGGAMSCIYAGNHSEKISELWLFAAYCGNDISNSNIKTVSVHGSLDGVINSQKLADNRKNLPATASIYEVEGMNHAQFGNYETQSGDNQPTRSDEEIRRELINIFSKIYF